MLGMREFDASDPNIPPALTLSSVNNLQKKKKEIEVQSLEMRVRRHEDYGNRTTYFISAFTISRISLDRIEKKIQLKHNY